MSLQVINLVAAVGSAYWMVRAYQHHQRWPDYPLAFTFANAGSMLLNIVIWAAFR